MSKFKKENKSSGTARSELADRGWVAELSWKLQLRNSCQKPSQLAKVVGATFSGGWGFSTGSRFTVEERKEGSWEIDEVERVDSPSSSKELDDNSVKQFNYYCTASYSKLNSKQKQIWKQSLGWCQSARKKYIQWVLKSLSPCRPYSMCLIIVSSVFFCWNSSPVNLQ